MEAVSQDLTTLFIYQSLVLLIETSPRLFMKEHGTFKGHRPTRNFRVLLSVLPIDLTAEQVAVAASTMALSRLCPLTGEKVFKSNTLKNTLALMST